MSNDRLLEELLAPSRNHDDDAAGHTGSITPSAGESPSSTPSTDAGPSTWGHEISVNAPEPGPGSPSGGAGGQKTMSHGALQGHQTPLPIVGVPPEGEPFIRPPLPSAANPAAEFVDLLVSRGVSVSLRGNRLFLSPGSAHRDMTPEERATLSLHRQAIKELVRTAGPFVSSQTRATAVLAPQPVEDVQPPSQPPSEPQPPGLTVFIGDTPISERMLNERWTPEIEHRVRECMADTGDEADYLAGRISRLTAFKRTVLTLRAGRSGL